MLQWSKKGVREDFQFPNVKNQFEVKPAQSYGFDCIIEKEIIGKHGENTNLGGGECNDLTQKDESVDGLLNVSHDYLELCNGLYL